MASKWKRKKGLEPDKDVVAVDTTELSPLGHCLLEQFAAGASGPSIQKLALAATKTFGESPADLIDLASLGNFGRNPGNCAEQLTTRYCKSEAGNLPRPYLLEVPVRVRSNVDCAVSVVTKDVAIYLPHDWFAWVVSDHISEDATEVLTGLSGLQKFWSEHNKSDPKLKGNPISKQKMEKYVPFVVHGDGGAFQRNDSINVLSMRSLLSAANVGLSQFLLFSIPKACVNKSDDIEEDTMHHIWRALAWSFEALFRGVHPVADHQGVVFALSGDGVTAHILANCCFDFVMKPGWVGGQDVKMKALFHRVLQQYEELCIASENRIGRLQPSNFCNPKNKFGQFPSMSGIKARHLRYLVPCFREICDHEKDERKPYTVHRWSCLHHMEIVYQCLEKASLHLDPGARRRIASSMDLCLQHYTKCCKLCMQEGFLQWNITHKHHLSCHLAAQAQYLNPKFVSTYTGETMVGYMASLGHACLNGTPPHLVPEKVCWRFRLGMWLKLLGQDFAEDEA
ncbi:unnamed protein product [Symbiodinium sp. CCMP2456]|nr:unnamed protein product [Symbiodinium sp. CCMP2456]